MCMRPRQMAFDSAAEAGGVGNHEPYTGNDETGA